MKTGRVRRRLLAASGLALFALLAIPSAAPAAFHLMKISEVFPGFAMDPDSAFVELQMFQSGQNLVGGHEIVVYNAAGAAVATVTMPGDVANGQNNRTILLGDGSVSGRDFDANIGTLVAPSGGAVCFPDGQPADCVSWGNFSNPGALPAPTGTPVAPAGIPDGLSIQRSIAPGCPTFLEASDDTDNSVADFLVAEETPRPNSDPVTEIKCTGPETKITKKPKKKTTRAKAKFKFKSPGPGGAAAKFQCRLDGGKWKLCKSPATYRKIKPGKHTFQVRAKLAGQTDPTPAKYRWKRKRQAPAARTTPLS